MKSYLFRVLLLSGFMLLLPASEAARAADYGNVTVTAIELYQNHDPTRRGYAGYCFGVTNKDSVPHTVRIKIPARHYQQSGLVSNSRTVKVPPKGTSKVWIYQPAINTSGRGEAVVTVDGRTYDSDPLQNADTELHGALENDSQSAGGPGQELSEEEIMVLNNLHSGMGNPSRNNGTAGSSDEAESLDKKAATPATSSFASAIQSKYGRGYSNDNFSMSVLVGQSMDGTLRDQLAKYLLNCNMVRSNQPTSEWPTSWLAYSQFDGVILSDKEFDTIDPAAVSALADYISLGGAVWVRPAEKQRAKLTEPMKELQQAAASGMGVFLRDRDRSSFREQAFANIQCGNSWRDATLAAKALPAVEKQVTPVRLFLVILVFYAIGIGPVLQFLLKLKRRRIWMLWIIPVTAILLCGVVFAGSYFAEGFHGFANFRNITVLDQTSKRASTVGWASFYSPLSDGDGLRFSTATVLQPQWQGQGNNEDKREVSMDWTNGQHLTTGWLQAKTPIAFRLWKAETRREKLTIRKDKSGTITATNALGADAEGLKLRMPDGTIYTAESIPVGETCTLTKTNLTQDADLPDVKNFCMTASNWLFGDDSRAIEKQYVRLEPGMYQVMLDGHPFVSTAITNPAKDQGKTLVLGRFEVEKK